MRAQFREYKFGQKNNWRRQCWNQIAKRVKNKNSGVVLYLPGPDDLDRSVAISKGFKSYNLIAVDRDPEIVSALRKQGKIAIQGEIQDIIAGWPASFPISVIFADLMCGMTETPLKVVNSSLISAGVSKDTVLAVNMLRGREQGDYAALVSFGQDIIKQVANGLEKHRGARLCSRYMNMLADMIIELQPHTPRHKAVLAVHNRIDPWLSSYRSTAGSQRFDSAIFSLAIEPDMQYEIGHIQQVYPNAVRSRRLAAASLAIRKQRINGKLPQPQRW